MTDLKSSIVSEVFHNPNKPLEDTIVKVLESIGGLSNFISVNDKILIKPNFNTVDPFPASTDPDFLYSIIKLIRKYTSDIQLIESSTLKANTKSIFETLMGDRLDEFKIPIIKKFRI